MEIENKETKTLERSIEEYHTDFHNFINLIKLGKWDELSEEERKEQGENMKAKINDYQEKFVNHLRYSSTLPAIVKYLGNFK